MRITSTGNVGIGTTQPGYMLDVNGTGRFSGALTGGSTATFSGQVEGTIINSTSNAFRFNGNNALSLVTLNSQSVVKINAAGFWGVQLVGANDQGIVINNTGNVGIGTTSPSYKLQVGDLANTSGVKNDIFVTGDTVNTDGYYARLIFGNSSQSGGSTASIRGERKTSNYGTELTFYTNEGGSAGNGSERMRITSGGDVYIGGSTSLASGALVVGDNSSTRPIVVRGLNGVDAAYTIGMAFYPWNTSESNAILNTVSSAASQSGIRFDVSNGGGTTGRTASFYINRTSCTVVGSLSKGSGSFKIKHPLASKKNTHQLVHSFIEGPQADLIYRGKIRLAAGRAIINIDEAATMTDGTFEALCREVQCFTSNETGWDTVRGKVEGNILTIESQNTESTDEISWLVIGERQDEHMMDTDWTDSNGKVIVEPLIPEENNNN